MKAARIVLTVLWLALASAAQKKRINVVLVGATGNLAEKYLWQGLYNIRTDGLATDDDIYVWPAASKKKNDGQPMLDTILQGNITTSDADSKTDFLSRVSDYVQLRSTEDYEAFGKVLDLQTEEEEVGRLFYLSVPPKFFGNIAVDIDKFLRPKNGGWLRVIVEKPFGVDLRSAQALAESLYQSLTPEEVLLVDHYMGKETMHGMRDFVQKQSVADRVKGYPAAIQQVEVGMLETDDAKGRTGFYDEVGVVRDTMQNHLMMMLALMAMDTSRSAAGSEEADLRKAVLEDLHEADLEDAVILAQYKDYNNHVNEDRAKWNEPPLEKRSTTPTYVDVALRMKSATSFLAGVPIHFKSGKAQDTRRSYVDVKFHDGSVLVFNLQGPSPYGPSGAFILSSLALGDFDAPAGWSKEETKAGYVAKSPAAPFAYEVLLRAGLEGRKENFVRLDEVLEAWRIWTPLLEVIDSTASERIAYDHGASLYKTGGLTHTHTGADHKEL